MVMLDFLSDLTVEAVPNITKVYNQQDLDDAPELYRWRAQWFTDDGIVTGIELAAHPVVSVTPHGAWIDQHAYRQMQRDGLAWNLSGEKRWVSNDGGQAWAKPTQEAALHSIAVRLQRWAQNVYRDAKRVHSAARVLKTLRPDDEIFARRALEAMSAIGSDKP